MSNKSFTLSLSKYQLASFRFLFEETELLETYSNAPNLQLQLVGLVLAELYKNKLLKKFTFPEQINKVKLSRIEATALACALLSRPALPSEFDTITIQTVTNQLHQFTV